jgi:hypothetical protein
MRPSCADTFAEHFAYSHIRVQDGHRAQKSNAVRPSGVIPAPKLKSRDELLRRVQKQLCQKLTAQACQEPYTRTHSYQIEGCIPGPATAHEPKDGGPAGPDIEEKVYALYHGGRDGSPNDHRT